MIFSKKKKNGVVRDPPEDPVISIFAGCLANHDRAHSQHYQSQGLTRVSRHLRAASASRPRAASAYTHRNSGQRSLARCACQFPAADPALSA